MPRRLLKFVRQPPDRRAELIIWYAIFLHCCWAAALLIGSGPITIMALRGIALLGRMPIAALCIVAAGLAIVAARRPPSMPGLLLLLPQQALLALGASEAVMAFAQSLATTDPQTIETVMTRLLHLLPLAILHTAAILGPFFYRDGRR